ncbi:FAD-dependent oxidoreductase [Solimonas sp. SE-A11]|uniref:FAD-dependent oxidoreductase n=1 Tax=Solimonas sp. SE-A11 TaxID=3054954 RepID=UPI00259D1521|nr:FAD-dependent oxidoreductase [Solimonas sp. SE-A11]MDM4769738.1 FAD-dependent oxidoreductase [Solimonas sp. SE-A11]
MSALLITGCDGGSGNGGPPPEVADRCIVPSTQAGLPTSADVIVYGATPSGITAASEAAKLGKSVILLEPSAYVGGKFGNGIGVGEVKNLASLETIGGMSREFYEQVRSFYGPRRVQDGLHFEPKVAERIMRGMACAHPGVTVITGSPLSTVGKSGTTLQVLTTPDGKNYTGKQFIDASYEGDLLAAAGVGFAIGRESSSQYNEPSAGVRLFGASHNVNFDPYVVPGDPSSGTIPLVDAEGPGPYGSGDDRLQAFTYRVCVTRQANNRVPFEAPPGYDPGQFEALARMAEAKIASGEGLRLDRLLTLQGLPNDKFDINNVRDLSVDLVGASHQYPLATPEQRREIAAAHERYVRSLLYFLTKSPRLPVDLRKAANKLGYCKDEYIDNGNFPRQLYVREARRMLGSFVLTENHLTAREAEKPIGVGSYWIDSHTVRLFARRGTVQAEGHLFTDIPPYQIPYAVLTPKASEATNLLVSVCVSSSRVAFQSLRLEPTYMIMGQAAGAAAAMAINQNAAVQDVDYPTLAAQLRSDKQVLDLAK